MTTIQLYRETNPEGQREQFYVPFFQVKIAGHDLPDDVVRDVMQVTYRDKIEAIDSFELTINNWDAQTGTFKYEPASQSNYRGVFDPGEKVELHMGYMDNVRVMLSGEITALEPNFPESGGPTLAVRGLNVLHAFRKQQHTWAWEDKRDSDIAIEIGRNAVSKDKPGLGIPVDAPALNGEDAEEFVFMNNQFDILFLLERARRHSYSVHLELDEDGEQRLYFGPATQLRDVTYELEWGKSLVSFRPTLTTENQIEQVTVRGWDRQAKKPIEGTAKIDQCDLNRDQTAVARAISGKHEVITDRPVRSKREAERLAKDILCGQLQEMVRAAGATVGLPDLRAGRKVHLRNLGARFDGEYFVTETTHTINDGGYRTTFSARRERGL